MSLLVVPVLLCLAATPACKAAEKTTIEEACLKAAEAASSRMSKDEGGEARYSYYDQCVRSLSSDRRSRDAADLHTLAAVAARMAVEHASATEARMEGLSEAEESPHARARLRHCLDLYGAAADVLRDALDNVRARVYGKAAQQLAAAVGAAESCEDVWKGEDHVPVAGHDREYGRIALLALGLTTGINTA
ncbi:hypothetical protein QOZ80_6BG0458070 [Eleusine coracana subsp. coracana]|nr:hypothetical protein QOZ80_6BG0458070 [Eleusine coracana subsp. coracana]